MFSHYLKDFKDKDSGISDELGRKRLLYEESGVQEYWVDDVNIGEVIAFAIADFPSISSFD